MDCSARAPLLEVGSITRNRGQWLPLSVHCGVDLFSDGEEVLAGLMPFPVEGAECTTSGFPPEFKSAVESD